ncbi:hypothetical protein SVIO_066820 [Streptomyces violaceusniger]|uniref:Uncharacterized protein n=1 Tax=Streptomyces violaceusniger TaxID=68280 RepID=A0A4D4LDP1_STRVO|nr:hypothetical protein SVIO_066820 [Streptomyces violaceusniger]
MGRARHRHRLDPLLPPGRPERRGGPLRRRRQRDAGLPAHRGPAAIRPGLPDDLDSVSRALEHPGTLTDQAADYLRRAVDTAVDHVYLGSATAALLALLALVFLTPRRFPVRTEAEPDAEA